MGRGFWGAGFGEGVLGRGFWGGVLGRGFWGRGFRERAGFGEGILGSGFWGGVLGWRFRGMEQVLGRGFWGMEQFWGGVLGQERCPSQAAPQDGRAQDVPRRAGFPLRADGAGAARGLLGVAQRGPRG